MNYKSCFDATEVWVTGRGPVRWMQKLRVGGGVTRYSKKGKTSSARGVEKLVESVDCHTRLVR